MFSWLFSRLLGCWKELLLSALLIALALGAPSQDNLAALPDLVARCLPEQVLCAGPKAGSQSARRLQQELARLGTAVIDLERGQSMELGEGARLRVLAIGRRGAVLLLEWRRFRALLPVGMDLDTLEALQRDQGQPSLSALLLPESGYAPLNPPEWIERLQPQVVLLSVAAGDWQGLPSPETLQAVERYTLLRTDRDGWIELATDGEVMWVEVERK